MRPRCATSPRATTIGWAGPMWATCPRRGRGFRTRLSPCGSTGAKPSSGWPRVLWLCALAACSGTITGTGPPKLITDPTLVFAIPQVPKPAYRVPIWPSPFGTKVIRIANDSGASMTLSTGPGTWGGDVRHHYSKDQPWSSDGTLLALQNRNGGSPNDIYLDGRTYQPTPRPCATD